MKLRTRRESKLKKIVIYSFLAMILITSSGFLAQETIKKVHILDETKGQLLLLEEDKNSLEKKVSTILKEEQVLKEQISELQTKLDEVQKNEPDILIAPGEEQKKYAYLTFDDGPSRNTTKILDFLKANNIQATFFVVGEPSQKNLYKRIFDEGHTLALHTYTHKFNEIYRSVEDFMSDIQRLSDFVEEITGVRPNILRFAGGSNTGLAKTYSGRDIMPQIIEEVTKQGIVYYDWNVDSADAAKANQDVQTIVDNVLQGAKVQNHAIILMHDAAVKGTTVEALPQIVEALKKQGFIFRAITQEVKPVQFR